MKNFVIIKKESIYLNGFLLPPDSFSPILELGAERPVGQDRLLPGQEVPELAEGLLGEAGRGQAELVGVLVEPEMVGTMLDVILLLVTLTSQLYCLVSSSAPGKSR